MEIIHFSFEVIDGKGETSIIELQAIDDVFTFVDCELAANAMIPIIRNIMVGGIGKVRVWAEMDWSDLKASFPTLGIPEEYADVEEKGKFRFLDHEHVIYVNHIPTLDETVMIPGTKQIDLTDIRVSAYCEMIQFGISAGAAEFIFCNSRGQIIEELKDGKEVFVPRSRRKKKK